MWVCRNASHLHKANITSPAQFNTHKNSIPFEISVAYWEIQVSAKAATFNNVNIIAEQKTPTVLLIFMFPINNHFCFHNSSYEFIGKKYEFGSKVAFDSNL